MFPSPSGNINDSLASHNITGYAFTAEFVMVATPYSKCPSQYLQSILFSTAVYSESIFILFIITIARQTSTWYLYVRPSSKLFFSVCGFDLFLGALCLFLLAPEKSAARLGQLPYIIRVLAYLLLSVLV